MGKTILTYAEGKSMHDGTLSGPWDESVTIMNQEESKIVDILTYAQVYTTVWQQAETCYLWSSIKPPTTLP